MLGICISIGDSAEKRKRERRKKTGAIRNDLELRRKKKPYVTIDTYIMNRQVKSFA